MELPLHPFQALGWLTIILLAFLTNACLVPSAQPKTLRPCLWLYFASVLFIYICFHFATVFLDPADPNIRKQTCSRRNHGTNNSEKKQEQNGGNSVVIENGFCYLCNSNISGPRTKHCGQCNK